MTNTAGKPPGRWRLLPLTALFCAAAVACAWWFNGQSVWTDGGSLAVSSSDANPRQIMWSAPVVLGGNLASEDQSYEPCLSSDGSELYFVRGKPGGGAHIYFSQRQSGDWTVPVPINSVNSASDDLGPRLSADEKLLYFYSNRPGGLGGFDIWASPREKAGWGKPFNLGPQVNSELDEYNPNPSPDGRSLVFATNRNAKTQPWRATVRQSSSANFDLWIAKAQTSTTQPSSQFASAVEIPVINVAGTQGSSCFSPSGDFLYFSSNRPAAPGKPVDKFDLYRTRITNDTFGPVENLGAIVNSTGNTTDPYLALGGYRLYFSSDRAGEGGRYQLYYSDSREVFPQRAVRPLPKLGTSGWLLFGSLVVLLPLLMMLRHWNHPQLGLLQRSLLVSLLVHVLLTFGLSFVVVSQKVAKYIKHENEKEITVSLNAPTEVQITTSIRNQISNDLPAAIAPAQIPKTEVIAPPPQPEHPKMVDVKMPQALPPVADVHLAPPHAVSPPPPPMPEVRIQKIDPVQVAITDPQIVKENQPAPAEKPEEIPPAPLPLTKPRTESESPLPVKQNIAAKMPAISPSPIAPAPEIIHQQLPATTPPPAPKSVPIEVATAQPEIVSQDLPKPQPRIDPSASPEIISPTTRPAMESRNPKPGTISVAVAPHAPTTMPVAEIAPVRPMPAQPAPLVPHSADISANPIVLAPIEIAPPSAADSIASPQAADVSTSVGRQQPITVSTSANIASTNNIPPTATPSNSVPVNLSPGANYKPPAMSAAAPAAPAVDVASISISPTFDAIASNTTIKPQPTDNAATPGFSSTEVAGLAPHKSDAAGNSAAAPTQDLISVVPAANSQITGIDQPATATTENAGAPRTILAGASPVPSAAAITIAPIAGSLGPEHLLAPESPFMRAPEQRKVMVDKLGGNKRSEDAVDHALTYLSKTQEPDGRWTLVQENSPAVGQRPKNGHDSAFTALSLLVFLARDHTPAKDGPYRELTSRAVEYLLSIQGADGDLRGPMDLRGEGSHHADMYDHGIATVALSEVALMTHDPRCTQAAIKAAEFIVKSQDRNGGGWRYSPGEAGDTSVLGWQIMALHSAEEVGFQIPQASREKAIHFMNSVTDGSHNGLGIYKTGTGPTASMTAELYFAKILFNQRPDSAADTEAINFIAQSDISKFDIYCWYYASLCMVQNQTAPWKQLNSRIRDALVQSQIRTNPSDPLYGSWPVELRWGDRAGRVFTTALSALTLECYYRYIPLRTDSTAEPK